MYLRAIIHSSLSRDERKILASPFICNVLIICGLDAFRKCVSFPAVWMKSTSGATPVIHVSSRSSSILLDDRLKTDMSPSKAKSMRQRSSERLKLLDRKAIIISFYHNQNTPSIVLHLIFINDTQSRINHQIVWTRLPCRVVLWLQRVMENILHLFWPCVAE